MTNQIAKQKKDDTKPTVSVIIPAYNMESYIEASVDTARTQTFKDIEIILVDDGSTDRTPEICDEIAKKDDRIVVIHKENGGLSDAMNTGLDCAKGDFISFLDADDGYYPEFIEILLLAIRKNDCDIAQGGLFAVRDLNRRVIHMRDPETEISDGREVALRSCGARDIEYIVVWNKLYKKELFSDTRYPIGEIQEDEFITWKLLWKAKRVAIVNALLHMYLQRDTSLMGSAFSRKHLQVVSALKERAEFFYAQGHAAQAISVWRRAEKELNRGIPILQEKGESVDDLRIELQAIREKLKGYEDQIDVGKRENTPSSDKRETSFPFDKIERGANVAIYGAGMVGTAYYRQLLESGYANKIVWVDRYAIRDRENVTSIDHVLDEDIDYVVVAFEDEATVLQITDFLYRMGVERNKIIG